MKRYQSSYKLIPHSIWALGFVSLFMDISSELVHSLLPLFMVTTLGASVTIVGVIEGIAEATALIVKIFSGTLSDYLKKRKLLTLIGYGMAAITKPLFPLADSIGSVLTARFIDRVGKGIRGAPRDALISDIAPPSIRGACFGLRKSLDTVGAFIGPLLAILFMWLFDNNIREVLWIAVIPAILCVTILIIGVKEPEIPIDATIEKVPFRIFDIRHVGSDYWHIITIAGTLTLARFSEAFLVLKALDTGISLAFAPMVMVLMNIIFSLAAYPAGMLSDRINHKIILLIGISFLIAADIMLGFAENIGMLAIGIILWGLHMAFTQGLFATMVAQTTPQRLRGTAYGVYNLVCGIAMLLASIIAGILWDQYGPSATFFAGALLTSFSLIGLLYLKDFKKPILRKSM